MINLSSSELKQLINNYLSGESLGSLGRKYKTRSDTVRNILVDNNIEIRGRGIQVNKEKYKTVRKYEFNQNYFEKIDRKDKAYWLGFLFADGNVHIRKGSHGSKGATIELGLKASDDYHIYNFIKCLECKKSIKYRNVKLNGKLYPSARIQLNSIKMAEDLIDKGCIPRKSLILKPPKNIPNDLISHFIRGYFDGDGTVGFYYDNVFNLGILGTNELLVWMQKIFNSNNIKSTIIKQNKNNYYELIITGRDSFERYFNFIYKDRNYFLGRKYDICVEALLHFNKEIDISDASKIFADL